MATVLRSLHFLLVLIVSSIPLAFPKDEKQFIYNGFRQAKLHLDGIAEIHPNGLLQLTDLSRMKSGHAFYPIPIRFKPSSSSNSSVSFSTNFEFAIAPGNPNHGGDGIAFTITPSTDFAHASPGGYLGLFNHSNNGLRTNHILAIELDTHMNNELHDTSDNEVAIDVNNITSIEVANGMYDDGSENINWQLISGNPMSLWIDYDKARLSVRLAPTGIPKLEEPLLSKPIDLSEILLEYMYSIDQ